MDKEEVRQTKRRIEVTEGPVFNENNKSKIYTNLKRGLPFSTACEISRVSSATGGSWISQGKREQEDYELGYLDMQTPHGKFYTECRQSIAEFVATRLDNMAEAGNDPKLWQANEAMLKYVDNALFGPKQQIKIDSDTKHTYTIEYVASDRWMGGTVLPKLPKKDDTMEANFVEGEVDVNDAE